MPSTKQQRSDVPTAQLRDMYETMIRCMLWEQKLLRMIDEGVVSGFFHSGRGQEGVQVGACAALRDDDYLMYAHRGIGYMIAKGVPMAKLFGDFVGTTAGTTKGLGAGIVHIGAPDLGVLGQSGTLGGCFPIAAGAAYSAKYRDAGQVCLCFFGDGTSNRGTFHESANAASVWKLPVIWLCENNGWAASVTAKESTSVENIADRAVAYDMPGVVVDGQDCSAVYEAVSEAVARARAGDGPSLIEAKCHRFRGHYEGDPQHYRSKEELEEQRQRDPIEIAAARLRDAGITEEELNSVSSRAQAEIDAAAEEALAAPKPTRDRIFEGLYA